MQKHEHVHKNLPSLFINNFLGGIAWALGATIGAALVLAVLGIVLQHVNVIPFVGDFVSQIVSYVDSQQPQIKR